MAQQLAKQSRKNHKYSAFGLTILSEVVLPELSPAVQETVDVEIVYGSLGAAYRMPCDESACGVFSPQAFLLRIASVADYYVTNGTSVVVQPWSNDPGEVRVYLLGLVMGVIMQQRGIMALHGSAVVVNGQAVIFAGSSGAGKSTMAAALRNKGHLLLADDVAVITFSKARLPWVQSGFPQQKLMFDSAAQVGIEAAALALVSQSWDKYAVPVTAGFEARPMPLKAIYQLTAQAEAELSLAPLTGFNKIAAIITNTYCYNLLEKVGLKLAHFNMCAGFLKEIPVFRLTRPLGQRSLQDQVRLWEKHFTDLLTGCQLNNTI